MRRVHIPKGTGTETRPIGIPTLEDKILQRAVVMLLEPIYEQEFHAGSYGFRPGRSAHDALESLWKQTMDIGGGCILEVDIRKFFDTLDHGRLREFLQRRVRDGVVLRLIGKWLNAGVTATSRMKRAVRKISQWCSRHYHQPLKEQHRTLCQKLRGHFGYYGITGNSKSLSSFKYLVTRVWRKWLCRRNRQREFCWARMNRLLAHYRLPSVVTAHSVCRLVANHDQKNRMR